MLKLCFKAKKDIDIGKYVKLTVYLKKSDDGYKQKKEMKSIGKKPNRKLSVKCPRQPISHEQATIFEIAGASRREKLATMTTHNIENKGGVLIITISKMKTNV